MLGAFSCKKLGLMVKETVSQPPRAVAAKRCTSATTNLMVDIRLAVLAARSSGSIDDFLRQAGP